MKHDYCITPDADAVVNKAGNSLLLETTSVWLLKNPLGTMLKCTDHLQSVVNTNYTQKTVYHIDIILADILIIYLLLS